MRLLLLLLALLVATPAIGAGDDTTLGSPVVDTKSIAKWKAARLMVSQFNGFHAAVIVLGVDSGGDWIPGTETLLDINTSGTSISGYGLLAAGLQQTCSVTFGQFVSTTATGYNFAVKSLLTTCLGGS